MGRALIKSYLIAVSVVCAALLSGCTALPGPARVEKLPARAGVAFEGLISTDQDRPGTRYIFQIHGINSPGFKWGRELLRAIPKYDYDFDGNQSYYWQKAQLSQNYAVKGRDIVCDAPHENCQFSSFGKYRKDVFVNRFTHDRVVVFSYSWRDDLWSITGHYLKPDIAENTLSGPTTRRSLANAYLKVNVMDEGLSDAVGYLSRVGSLEREGLETSICAMLADAVGAQTAPYGKDCLTRFSALDILKLDKTEFNFLSHSLGSRMIYDVLSGVTPETGENRPEDQLGVRTALRRRTHELIMAANQMPLLAASEFRVEATPPPLPPPPGSPAQPAANLEQPLGFINLNSKPRAGSAWASIGPTLHLTVIAFQDPDDLLGFKASDAVLGANDDSLSFVDILHRNTPQWAFLLAWPPDAHDHELSEPNSLKMILCGADVGADGRLKARSCAPSKGG